jgi:hypothetical protein
MAFAPNPPPSDAAASYHIDFLAALAGLRHGPNLYFYDVRTLLQALHANVPFIGGPQTSNYLESVIFSRQVADAIGISPIFRRLGIQSTRLWHLVGEHTIYSALMQDEGSYIEPGRAACKISGNSFCTSLVSTLAYQIWSFQSLLAQRARAESDRQRELSPERYAGAMVPFATMRLASPRIGAYAARAHLKAGYERMNARRREALSAAVNENLVETGWAVRNSDFLARIDRRALLLRTGIFLDAVADELVAGRIVAVTEEEFVRNDLHGLLLGSWSKQPRTYYSETGYFFLDRLLHEVPEAVNGVLMTDSCYGTTFCPSARGLYGAGVPTQGVRGVSIESALAEFPVVGEMRAAVYRIPCVEARSMRDLSAIVDVIQRIAPGPLFFRGQTRHFSVKRPSSVNEMLYGESTVDELSLMTSAARAKFDWDHFQYRFQLQCQGLLYADLPARRFETHDTDEEGTLLFADVEVQRRYAWWARRFLEFEQASMGIAQHYGIPTDGLDLTSDLGVAIWFATSVYLSRDLDGEGTSAWFRPLEAGAARPVIYMIAADLNPASEVPIPTLAGLRSLRAERQSAHLHYGGWGMHTNLCATETIAAIFLSPICVAQATQRWMEVEELFPGQDDDRLYNELLALRQASARVGQPWGFDRIVHYTSRM